MPIAGPHLLTPARTKAWLRVPGPNYENDAPVRSEFTVTFSASTTAGMSLELVLGIGTVTMGCGSLGDGVSWLPGSGINASATNFQQGAEQNALLSGAYTITRSGATVTFQARLPGPQYDLLSATPSGAFATGTSTVTGVARSLAVNYSVCIRPLVYTGADTPDGYEALPEEVALPGTDEHAEFDLGELLRPSLRPEWVANGATTAHLHTLSHRPYYVEYYERYGQPATNRVVNRYGSPSAPKLACLMGYQRRDHDLFLQFLDWVADLSGQGHYFLTWRNRKARRYVTTAEEHSLGWYFWDMEASPTALTLRAKLTHTAANGTDPQTTAWSNRYTATVGTEVVRGRVSSWPVGYNQLGLSALLPTDRVAQSYTVQVNDQADGTGAKSEDLTFYLAAPDHNERFIQFTNSLGVPESLRTIGAWSETYQGDFLELARQLTYADLSDQLAGSRSSEPKGGQHYLNVITGLHAQPEHRALMDILGSPRDGIRVQVPGLGGNGWVPVRLLKAEEIPVSRRGTEEEHVYSMALQFALDDPQPFRTVVPTVLDAVFNEADGPGPDPGGGEGG